MRENRLSGSEGGATSSRPYPYPSFRPYGTKLTPVSLTHGRSPLPAASRYDPFTTRARYTVRFYATLNRRLQNHRVSWPHHHRRQDDTRSEAVARPR